MRKAISFVVLAIVLAVSACGGSPQSVEYERTKVNYLTSFNTFGRDAYAYVAQEKGFFDQAGLDVTITPGTGSVDVLKLVAGGRADFGIADFTATAITVAKEKLPVTTVAAVHQKSLAAIVALEGSGISKPADLVGKKIGDQPGSTNQVMFPVYAKAVCPPNSTQAHRGSGLVANSTDTSSCVDMPPIAPAAQPEAVDATGRSRWPRWYRKCGRPQTSPATSATRTSVDPPHHAAAVMRRHPGRSWPMPPGPRATSGTTPSPP